MTAEFLWVYFLVITRCLVQNTHAQDINGKILANELSKVADAVGFYFMQNVYNNLEYQETRTDGEKLAREISEKISGRMTKIATALVDLKSAVETDQLSSAVLPQECCMDGVYQENARLRTNVSLEILCYSRPSYVPEDDLGYPSVDVLNKFKTNFHETSLQYQYIVLQSGIYFQYPATELSNCKTYDPRFRPFYVSTTTSNPRDVVVVLELSDSMRGYKSSQASHAALTVMESLSVQDRFGLIIFNEKAETPNGCYGDQLVPITHRTRQSLRQFMGSRIVAGGAHFAKGLHRAFAYFKSATDGKHRDQILLFVSDGSYDGDDPLEVIRDENQQLNNRVVIHTYGIGTGLSSEDKQLLKDMADQTLNNNSYGHVKSGKSVILADIASTSLPEAMGTFYDDSSIPMTDTPTYTMPYKDLFTNESIITGCLPIAIKGAFGGVVCADVLLCELVAEILYLNEGEFSYAFVIDGEERTLVHPLIPDPRDVIVNEQDVINIYNFETSGDVNVVIQSMTKGLKGHIKALFTKVMKTRGQKYLEGDSQQIINASYHWTPIVAPGSNLSVCLVMDENNSELSITNVLHSSPGDFVYHRWDLDKWPGPFCRHFNRYATQAKTTVKLTPDAFTEPYKYTRTKETEVRVQEFKDYLSGKRVTSPDLKPSAIKSIRITYPIEEFWKTYHRTVAQKEVHVVSAPYEDSWGSGKIISLTKAILIGRSKKTEGVLGTDFSIYYFDQMLQDIYPICANKTSYSCIVIDNSGFLVMHPYYIETTSPITTQVHITHLEGRISRSLISQNVMYRQPCRDTENKKEQFTYRVELFQSSDEGIVDKTVGYQMRPVANSNVFIILKERRASIEDLPCCFEKVSMSPSSIQCEDTQCTCLCYKGLQFNDCRNEYNSR
ncbi:VWFA and cache domain-containing protein 1-like [Crassostrea virginica]